MTYVIVGGSSGLGRALAERFAAAGHDLIVVSSDERDITATAADLTIRHQRRVVPIAADVADLNLYLMKLTAAVDQVNGVDGFLFPVGAVVAADDGGLDASEAEWLMRVNFLSVVATVAAFLPALKARPQATVAGFGSVAAARGRGNNAVYGAAKRALAAFFESLRHVCATSGVSVQFYVLGYLDTNLAFGRGILLPRANPDALSARVLRDLGRDRGVVYYPSFWRYVCFAVQLLPWIVFRRLRF